MLTLTLLEVTKPWGYPDLTEGDDTSCLPWLYRRWQQPVFTLTLLEVTATSYIYHDFTGGDNPLCLPWPYWMWCLGFTLTLLEVMTPHAYLDFTGGDNSLCLPWPYWRWQQHLTFNLTILEVTTLMFTLTLLKVMPWVYLDLTGGDNTLGVYLDLTGGDKALGLPWPYWRWQRLGCLPWPYWRWHHLGLTLTTRFLSLLHWATPLLQEMMLCTALFRPCCTSSSAGCITMLGMANVALVRKNGRLSFLASPYKEPSPDEDKPGFYFILGRGSRLDPCLTWSRAFPVKTDL